MTAVIQEGVRVSEMRDPENYGVIYFYESVSTDKLVKIEWKDACGSGRVQYLEPGEKTTIKISASVFEISKFGASAPRVTLLNNGL